MTREEAIKQLKDDRVLCINSETEPFAIAYDMAIKAIEQEPCEVGTKPIVHAHWIEGQTDNPNIHNILCSHCFEGYPSKGHANSQYTKKKFQWCPHCGAKMCERGREE